MEKHTILCLLSEAGVGSNLQILLGLLTETYGLRGFLNSAEIVGHSLKFHTYDDYGRQGSFNARHAEKQLMASFLWHYTSLQEEPEQQAPEREWARYGRVGELHQCISNGIHLKLTGSGCPVCTSQTLQPASVFNLRLRTRLPCIELNEKVIDRMIGQLSLLAAQEMLGACSAPSLYETQLTYVL